MNKLMRIALILSASLLILPAALATDYYVSTVGHDTECNGLSNAAWDPVGGAGQTCAWKTVNKCVGSSTCGDTCNVATGNYYEPEISLSSKSCTSGTPFILQGATTAGTILGLNMVAIDTASCTLKSGSSVVYLCPVPTLGDTTNDANLSIFQDVDNTPVTWGEQYSVGGEMIDWVPVTWLTSTTNLEATAGTAYYNSGTGNYEIHLWGDAAPTVNKLMVSRSANDGFYSSGASYVTLSTFTIISSRRAFFGASSSNFTIDDVTAYGGGFNFSSDSNFTITDLNIYNIIGRPNDGITSDCNGCWTPGGDAAFTTAFQGITVTGFDVDRLEIYASRNGFTNSGSSANNTYKHLKIHGGFNHNLEIQDPDVHDLLFQDSAFYNSQETLFVVCAYDVTFEHCTFGPSGQSATGSQNGLLIKALVGPGGCPAETPRNIDIFNSIINSSGLWFYEASTDARANATTNNEDFDLDYNDYTTDTSGSFVHEWRANGPAPNTPVPMTFSEWQSWSSDPSATPTRDPNSLHSQTRAQTHVNPVWNQDDIVTNPVDLGLISGSVAIGLSDGVHNGTGIDLAGNTRSAPYDAGAYEYTGAAAECGDGLDNDGDGATDYPADYGCTSASDTSEVGATQCGDGLDNDSDGDIDQNDSDCTGPSDDDESSAPPATATPTQLKNVKAKNVQVR